MWRQKHSIRSHEQSSSIVGQTSREVRPEGKHVQEEGVQGGAVKVQPHPQGLGLHEQPPRGNPAGEG